MTHSLKYRLNYNFRLIMRKSPKSERLSIGDGITHSLTGAWGNLLISIFINHSPNGFYFYHRQLTTRIKNILLSNFQSVELCSAEGLAVGSDHLPFRGLCACGRDRQRNTEHNVDVDVDTLGNLGE